MGGWPFGPDAGELLRARGLRVTPQRRAILGAFSDGAAEHLSADEIHARAAAVVPELGRGTVYADARRADRARDPRGARQPRAGALRDQHRAAPALPLPAVPAGVRRRPRRAGARRARARASSSSRSRSPRRASAPSASPTTRACAPVRSVHAAGARPTCRSASPRPPPKRPVGTLTLGATPAGVVRAVFDGHGDVTALAEAIDGRRGEPQPPARTSRPRRTSSRHTSPANPPATAKSTGTESKARHTLRAAMTVPRAQLGVLRRARHAHERVRARPRARQQPARDPRALPPRHTRP